MFRECDLLLRILSANSWLNVRFGSEPKSLKDKAIELYDEGKLKHKIKLKKLEIKNSNSYYK